MCSYYNVGEIRIEKEANLDPGGLVENPSILIGRNFDMLDRYHYASCAVGTFSIDHIHGARTSGIEVKSIRRL
jgi:hypothetical protein